MNLTYPCNRYGQDTKLMITALLTNGQAESSKPIVPQTRLDLSDLSNTV